MEARNANKRLTRLAVLVLLALLACGLWQTYGAWALDAVRARAH
jgi:hypothetical protein